MKSLLWQSICAGFFVGQADDVALRLLLDAYVTNRESITAAHGELLHTKYYSTRSMTDAINATSEAGVEESISLWFNGPNCRIDEMYDPELTRSTKRELSRGQFQMQYTSSRRLTDGTNSLEVTVPVFENHVCQALVEPGTESFGHLHAFMPLCLGLPKPIRPVDSFDLETCILEILSSDGRLTAETEPRTFEQSEVHELRVFQKNQLWRRYLVDLEHGAIPLLIEGFEDGKLILMQKNDQLRRINDAAWLPYHVRFCLNISNQKTRTLVRDLQVTSFDPEKPAAVNLRMPLPKGCRFANTITSEAFQVDEPSYFGFGEYAEQISKLPGSLGTIISRTDTALDRDEKPPVVWSLWKLCIIAFCLALFCLAAAVKMKRYLASR